MKYYQTFTVTGRGYFAFDMLRYDTCWPRTQESVVDMGADFMSGLRSVAIARSVDSAKMLPTTQLWRSFGWAVSNVETRKV